MRGALGGGPTMNAGGAGEGRLVAVLPTKTLPSQPLVARHAFRFGNAFAGKPQGV